MGAQVRGRSLLVSLFLALAGCPGPGPGPGPSGSDGGGSGGVTVVVSPATALVTMGRARTFTASVTGTSNPAVTWSVAEPPGGSVDSGGTYTAGWVPGVFHVRATSLADPTAVGAAEVTVVGLPGIQSFVAVPATIEPGGSASLVGVFSNGTGVVTPGSVPLVSGVPLAVQPVADTTYTLTVVNAAGDSVTDTASVAVRAGVPTITQFTSSAAEVDPGGTAWLLPVFSGGSGAIAPGVGAVTSGASVPVTPATTTTYTLTVSAPDRTPATAQTTVAVRSAGPGSTAPGGTLATARAELAAVALPGGDVLVLGGGTAQVERWSAGSFAAAGTLSTARARAGAVLLADGRVLVAGAESGAAHATAEVFDPATGTSGAPFALAIGRKGPALMRLADGRVLVAGGASASDGPLDTAELWDPAAPGATTTVATTARRSPGVVLLADGRVLVCGGFGANGAPLSSAEIFDPATDTFAAAGVMSEARAAHSVVRLLDGRVLAAGGRGVAGRLASAEIFQPLTGAWTSADPLAQARSQAAAVLLPSNEVLILGGDDETGALASVERWSPSSGWSPNASLAAPRAGAAALRLADGRALVVGGTGAAGALGGAELYDAQLSGTSVRGVPLEPGVEAVVDVPGAIRVAVPGAAVESAGSLTVTAGAAQPPAAPSVGQAVASWRVEMSSLSGGRALSAPATMTFRTDLSGLPSGSDPADRVWVAWWDARNGVLVEEPCVVDAAAGTVTVSTVHFSSWWLYVLGPGDVEGVSPHFRYRFPANIDIVAWGVNDVYQVMARVRTTLENAYDAYVAAGFSGPSGKITVYLRQTEEAGYNPLTGNITLSSAVYTSDMRVYEHELAHEVFHAFQNARLNLFSMDKRRWFVEAAADYAADAIAVHSGQMGKDIRSDWIGKDLTTVDGNHEYATSHFLKWLVNRKGKNFKVLHDAVFGTWAAADKGEGAFATAVGGPFAQTMKEYAMWLWTDPASPVASKPLWAQQAGVMMRGSANGFEGIVPARFRPLTFALTASLPAGDQARLAWDRDGAPPAMMRVLRGGARTPTPEEPPPNVFPKLAGGDVLLVVVLEEHDLPVSVLYMLGPNPTHEERTATATGTVPGTFGASTGSVHGIARIDVPYGVELVSFEPGSCGGSASGKTPVACTAFRVTVRSPDPTETIACTLLGSTLADPGWGTSGRVNWYVTGADVVMDGQPLTGGAFGGSLAVPVTGGASSVWSPRKVEQDAFDDQGTRVSHTETAIVLGEAQLEIVAAGP